MTDATPPGVSVRQVAFQEGRGSTQGQDDRCQGHEQVEDLPGLLQVPALDGQLLRGVAQGGAAAVQADMAW